MSSIPFVDRIGMIWSISIIVGGKKEEHITRRSNAIETSFRDDLALTYHHRDKFYYVESSVDYSLVISPSRRLTQW